MELGRRSGIVVMVVALVWGGCLARCTAQEPQGDVRWHDIRGFGVEGQGWAEGECRAPFDRLPARAEGVVRDPVWQLSRHAAGLCVRFVTDAPVIHARWSLTSDRLAMPHMAATGVSGLDLYARPLGGGDGPWRWLAVGQPKAEGRNQTTVLVTGLPPERREYLLYLPLYNGVSAVDVGVPPGHELAAAPARPESRRKPLVFYGTSITHGACASRPGMVHTAILQRRYDRPVINLGFSGNGKMDAEVGDLLGEIDAAVYVIDCCPNLTPEETAARTEALVGRLRRARPEVPILLVEDRRYADAWLLPGRRERNDGNHRELAAAYARLRGAGVPALHYLAGDGLLGEDGDGTVDASHPNDLGFARQAAAFATVLDPILGR